MLHALWNTTRSEESTTGQVRRTNGKETLVTPNEVSKVG